MDFLKSESEIILLEFQFRIPERVVCLDFEDSVGCFFLPADSHILSYSLLVMLVKLVMVVMGRVVRAPH